ncbi:DNA-3-methyladenine glycosylase I [Neoroseomonas oryzicola]|uniref:DNA-3-methyladenine glycosylase I n=1 Tax=Neoroseomonas oryzicola TaxID=535904 RepID=A0A9X9WDD0_9PROT|nr:DNA-3-methyladenine glycosylase I [Neoroseomonas oryzicola]MBR0658340.1 DNA-3-methyladenine glycosylase I [Neoroseomonas oryzicola]NKE18505.1 DNA-3-methyladenine glycosylase I [Neoroseomonas oryzicola]
MSADPVTRCAWAERDPLERHYHDTEWGVPVRDGRALWECLMLEGFQAGLSWTVILRKREAFRAAFAGFDPVKVAAFDEADIVRLLADPGIVRSRAKIEATIAGARIFNAMQAAGEDFADFCWSFTGGATVRGNGSSVTPLSERASKELKRRGFKFVGPTIVHAWMQAVGIVDDHAPGCFLHRAG